MTMKRQLKTLLIASAMSVFATAHGAQLLVGSYTDGTSEGLYRYAFNSDSGQIEAKPLQVLKSENPSWLTLSIDNRLLFAVNENGAGKGQASSFSVSAKDGSLKALNQVSSAGDEPTHASLSHDQRYLFVANYGGQPQRVAGGQGRQIVWLGAAGPAQGQRRQSAAPGRPACAFGGVLA
jgi:DNA-binding beta-propeller fold protein YncE